MPGPQHGQDSGYQLAAFGVGCLENIVLKRAQLWLFDAGIELTKQGTPGQVAGDYQIIAVSKERGSVWHVDLLALPQQADIEQRLGQRLTKKNARQLAVAIVDRDDVVARDQRSAQPLFEFFLRLALRYHRRAMTGEQDRDQVNQQQLAGACDRGGESIQRADIHCPPVERSQKSAERHRAVDLFDKREFLQQCLVEIFQRRQRIIAGWLVSDRWENLLLRNEQQPAGRIIAGLFT